MGGVTVWMVPTRWGPAGPQHVEWLLDGQTASRKSDSAGRQTPIMERIEMCGDRMVTRQQGGRRLAATGDPGTVQPAVVATNHAGLVLATPCPAGRRTAGQCQPQVVQPASAGPDRKTGGECRM